MFVVVVVRVVVPRSVRRLVLGVVVVGVVVLVVLSL